MPNIHTIRDFQSTSSNQPYANQQNYRPVMAGQGQGAVFVMPGQQPGDAVSLMAPADPTDPSLVSRCFPWISWRTFTAVISVIQVIMFIITLIVGGVKFDGAVVKGNGMLGPSAETLKYMGGKWEPDIRAGKIYLLITPIFLHAGFIHLLSNLFFQLRFGFVLEQRWTIPKYIITYFATGIGASFLSSIQSPYSVSVGASGALFGVLGANIAYLIYNWNRIPHNKQEACMLTFVVVINLLMGIDGTVDNWAHFGGLITGLTIGASLPTPVEKRPHEDLIRRVLAALCAGLFLMYSLLLWYGNPGN